MGKVVLILLACAMSVSALAEELPGGALPLTEQRDLVDVMLDGIHQFLNREIQASPERREKFWKRDFTSPAAYAESIKANRETFRKRIGAIAPLVETSEFEVTGDLKFGFELASNASCAAYAVRWPVLDGVYAEGLLLMPQGAKGDATIIILPDADMPPEALAGMAPGEKTLPADREIGRILAAQGYQVLIPVLINRDCEFSGNAAINKLTNQPHREFIYRMSYELGLHIIGLEVQKVMAAVTAIRRQEGAAERKIGVIGYSEGGLIALYSGALDERVNATCVSGYFQSRETLWNEPIYRNVWGLLEQFGDADIAGMIAPRPLIIEACKAPEIAGPPPRSPGRSGAAPGTITTPPDALVEYEFTIAKGIYQKLGSEANIELVKSGDAGPFSSESRKASLKALGFAETGEPSSSPLKAHGSVDLHARMQRQFSQFVEFVQKRLRMSHLEREAFWKSQLPEAEKVPAEKWDAAAEPLRKYFAEEVIGKIDAPFMAPNPRMRKIEEQEKFIVYETVLDVWPDVIASGLLLMPKDLKPGEKRPVVVCQHGLEGRPMETVKYDKVYQAFAAKLAERGFITYAPQNPYIKEDRFRSIQRKANPLGKSLFSFIVGQHQQLINWLTTLSFVDPNRIAFYGLSYGGKTAMRVPAIEQRYCLSICSADFNEWITKNATVDSHYSYMFTGEYEIIEFDLGRTFNYSDLARLISPRPFMVERGHHDGVAPDEWVGHEYALVRRHYDLLGIGDRTELEYFDGPHQIHAVGTFDFLHRHLNWPAPKGD